MWGGRSANRAIPVRICEHPLRAIAVDPLQQQGHQQLLRRDRGPGTLGAQPEKAWSQPVEHLVVQLLYLPHGVALGDSVLGWGRRRTEDRSVPAGRASARFRWANLPRLG